MRSVRAVGWVCLVAGLGAGCSRTSTLEEALNAWMRAQYPDGHEADGPISEGDEPATDDRTAVWSSQILTPTAPVDDVGDVSALCIGFGDPRDAWCIPTDDPDVSAGGGRSGSSVSGQVRMPPDLCANLEEICHDITCYEFAETDAGTFTAANIEYLAAACGDCDAPSCQDLIGECSLDGFCLTDADCGPDQACVLGQCLGGGALQFTLSWAAQGTDFDLYVQTPSGAVISYQNERADGGSLDHDDTDGGANSIENIFFETAASGEYAVWVDLYSGSGGSFSLAAVVDGAVALQEGANLTNGRSETFYVSY
jgi:hypothetical protein